jgi:hypothetical protein
MFSISTFILDNQKSNFPEDRPVLSLFDKLQGAGGTPQDTLGIRWVPTKIALQRNINIGFSEYRFGRTRSPTHNTLANFLPLEDDDVL